MSINSIKISFVVCTLALRLLQVNIRPGNKLAICHSNSHPATFSYTHVNIPIYACQPILTCSCQLTHLVFKLTVNVSKTKFMIFHKRRVAPQLELLLNNIKIEPVSNFTFLGIILDTSLSWKYHTKMIAIKISKTVGILHKLKYIFPKEILLIIYKSLIMPHLNYGLLLWGVNLKDIFLQKKKAIRLVTHNTYNSHTEPIFKENGLLNLVDMFLLNKLKFLHKLFHNNLPSYFQTYWEHFTYLIVNYNLRSRVLPVSRIHHVYAESLFVYQLVKILNDFDSLTIIKLRERSHSFSGFSTYVTRNFIEKYSDHKICDVPACFACK